MTRWIEPGKGLEAWLEEQRIGPPDDIGEMVARPVRPPQALPAPQFAIAAGGDESDG